MASFSKFSDLWEYWSARALFFFSFIFQKGLGRLQGCIWEYHRCRITIEERNREDGYLISDDDEF